MAGNWLPGRAQRRDDSEVELNALGTERPVPKELSKLAAFVKKAQPKGPAPEQLFADLSEALDDWRELAVGQQADELSLQVGKVLESISKSAENAGLVADLMLVGELQQRLLTLQAAVKVTR